MNDKIIQCNKCNAMFPLSSVNIYDTEVKTDNGKLLKVKFFMCQECNEIYICFINNLKMQEYINDYDKTTKKLEKTNDLVKKQRLMQMLATKKNRLEKYQKRLMQHYTKYFKFFVEDNEIKAVYDCKN